MLDESRAGPSGGDVLNIQLDEGDDYTVCRPVGELDAYTVGQFREARHETEESSRARRFV